MATARMDRGSMEALYRAHGSMVYRRASAILGNDAAARDAVQEVFVRAIRSGVEIWDDVSPTTWLYRVTTNYCLNVTRDERRRLELLDARHPRRATTTNALEDRVFLREVMRGVPEDLAEVAVYYYLDQMKQSEIADVLGVSRRTVGNRLEAFREHASRIAEGGPR